MNLNSKICSFIAEHKEDWADILKKEYKIRSKINAPYAVFNYIIGCDFSNPIVQEARGIIINLETLEVVCWPFRKFGNYNESYADAIDWNTAKVQEKIDGSIIKLWFDEKADAWVFATNATIYAKDAQIEEDTSDTEPLFFGELITQADNYSEIKFLELNKDWTYIFELVSPKTQVVVSYSNTHLYHIGTRNKNTGEEYDVDIGIEKPKMYALRSLSDCIAAVKDLNASFREDGVNNEGFVVVDGNWNRVKIKSPEYLLYHRSAELGKMSKFKIFEMIWLEEINLHDVCRNAPQHAHIFKYYDYKIEELKYQADVFVKQVRRIHEEYSGDRKLTAQAIAGHKLACIGFAGLGNNIPGRELIKRMNPKILAGFIPEYHLEETLTLHI